MSDHLRKLLSYEPKEALLTGKLFQELGISRQLARSYVDSGWLERLQRGIYKRKECELNWKGAVFSVQQQLKLPIHVSAQTALRLHKVSHHVAVNETSLPIFLSGPPKIVLPEWFKRIFFDRVRYSTNNLFSPELGTSLVHVPEGFHVVSSKPERALLEVIHQIRSDTDFEDASDLVDSYLYWDTNLLLNLLENCNSYKVRRVLMFLGDSHQIKPLIHVAPKVDLGSGKIQVVPKGRYISKYGITVPISAAGFNEENPF